MDQNRGKENKEAIERIVKRLQDYFQHKAHTKTKKKTNRRDSIAYSTMRQITLSGFISIKNNFVLISEGTLLSIPLARIKHSMSCSFNFTCHSFERASILLPRVCDY